MKKTLKLISAAVLGIAALGAVSCQKEMQDNSQTVVTEADLPKVTAYAPGYNPNTKTVIKNETEVWWQAGDAINVFFADDTDLGKFTSLGSHDKQAAIFMGEKPFAMGSLGADSPYKFWGIYPYDASNTCDNESVTLSIPETQTAVKGSFDPKVFASVAKSNDMTFAFYNVCGGVRFSVTKAGVTKVTFKGNNNENLAGKVKVSMDSESKPVAEVVEGKTEVVLICAEGLTVGSWYFISLLPGTLTSGYTLRFDTATQYAEKTSSASIEVRRSTFGSLANADAGLTYNEFIPEMVDLGLSVKWAKCNLGATKPEGYGKYYQWGDTVGYGSDTSDGKYFYWSSYKWCNGTSTTLTKYNTSTSYGTYDYKTVLEMADDAARAAWGGSWRMPTDAEWDELRNTNNCSWTWTTLYGINGYKVQSKKSGYTDNWIFLPAAGNRYGSDLKDVGSLGGYWSSSLDRYFPNLAWYVYFLSDNVFSNLNCHRCYGLSVRPVSEKPAQDLSASGTANCYIVSGLGNYKFNASVKGCSTESVGTVASAEVLWESFGTDTVPWVGDLVNSVSYADGYISFKATSNKGNAVIAAKDASGNILWSWHIWLTDKPADQVYNNNAGTMMDRNLGATSCTPGDVHALGLLYQWGRKDPFLGGCQISDSSYDGQTKAVSTITWPSAVSSDASNGTISYAVSHPTTFIKENDNNGDWYYTGSSSTDHTRWHTNKGTYDPCPPGYRVPDGGSPGIWSKAFGTYSSWETSSNWDSTNKGMDFSKTDKKLSSNASSVWYPAAGYRNRNNDVLYSVGECGYYWSCSPVYNGAYQLYFVSNGFVCQTLGAGGHADCRSVRCMR